MKLTFSLRSLPCGSLVYNVEKLNAFIDLASFLEFKLITLYNQKTINTLKKLHLYYRTIIVCKNSKG